MSAFYEEMRALADELLTEFGRPVTLRRFAANQNDLVEGTVGRTIVLSQTLNAAILPASGGTVEAFDVRFFDGLNASLNLRFAIISAEGATFMPQPNDEATFEGRDWQVMGCTPLNVDGTAVIYSVGFRGP